MAGVVVGVGVAAFAGMAWCAEVRHPRRSDRELETDEPSSRSAPSVTVVHPGPGGIPRTIEQPAIMHAFESVDLYAMISGYLKTQNVDIGSTIKKGRGSRRNQCAAGHESTSRRRERW